MGDGWAEEGKVGSEDLGFGIWDLGGERESGEARLASPV